MITLQRKGTLGRTNQILSESSHVSNLNLLNLTILLGVIILQFFYVIQAKNKQKTYSTMLEKNQNNVEKSSHPSPPQKK